MDGAVSVDQAVELIALADQALYRWAIVVGQTVRIAQIEQVAVNQLTFRVGKRSVIKLPGAGLDAVVAQQFEVSQRILDAGYTLLEDRDEVNNPSSHATGPHWHFVIGEGR